MQPQQIGVPLTLFYSYAHKDKRLRQELEKHLSALQRQGIIVGWHDRDIRAGSDWANALDAWSRSSALEVQQLF